MSRTLPDSGPTAPPPGPSSAPGGAPLAWLFAGLALVAVTVLVYCPCLDHPFVNIDDPGYASQNPHVQAGLTADGVRWAFTNIESGNWHPLTWLSLQLDATLFGGRNAGGFHLTNVLLHTANTLLLFLVLGWMTGAVGRSAVVAALFALHPLHVEPVAWVAERKGVLSTLFWMLALAAYLHYVRRPGIGRYLPVVLALVLGLMAKPMLLTLPAVLLLLDYWPLRRWRPGPEAVPWRRLLLEKVPLFAVVLLWSAVAFVSQRGIRALPSVQAYPLDVRVLNALLACATYLGKTFWPLHLAVYYPHPGAAVPVLPALAAGLLLAVLTMLALGPGRRRPYLAVGWLWYLVTLVPVIGLVQIGDHAMADRYTYVPLIGLFLLLTWGAADLASAWHLPSVCPAAVAGLVLSACVALTWTQLGYWRGDRELWEHALAVTGTNALAHNNLGMYLYGQGQAGAAEAEFAQAAAIDPDTPLYHHNLGNVLRDLGRPEEAAAEFRTVAALDPHDAVSHFNLGDLLRALGRPEEAEAEYRTAIARAPGQPVPHNNLASLLRELGRPEEAEAEYRTAADLDPGYALPHAGLGDVLTDLDRRPEAVAEYRRAVALDPESAAVHTHLGLALQAEGRLDEALAEYREAVALGYPPAGPRLRACTRLKALRPRLDDLVAGRDRPADDLERLAFADLCRQPFVGRYALAAHLYAHAFGADVALADDLGAANRSSAAVAAARAGCGQGQDAAGLDDREKARLRGQALTWFRADLALWAEQARSDVPQARTAARQALRGWQRDPGLAPVRDAARVAALPADEREAWRKLWQDVEAVLAGMGAPVRTVKKP